MVQGKITEADTSAIQLGATPSKPISDPVSSSPHFYAGCRSCCNPPNLSWLETGTKCAGLHAQWLGSMFTIILFKYFYLLPYITIYL